MPSSRKATTFVKIKLMITNKTILPLIKKPFQIETVLQAYLLFVYHYKSNLMPCANGNSSE